MKRHWSRSCRATSEDTQCIQSPELMPWAFEYIVFLVRSPNIREKSAELNQFKIPEIATTMKITGERKFSIVPTWGVKQFWHKQDIVCPCGAHAPEEAPLPAASLVSISVHCNKLTHTQPPYSAIKSGRNYTNTSIIAHIKPLMVSRHHHFQTVGIYTKRSLRQF